MKKTKLKYLILFLFLLAFKLEAQIYNYTSREYYDYNEEKKQMILASEDKVASSLSFNQAKKTIIFRIDGIEEFATYDNILSKGVMTSKSGESFLHYIYVGPKNDVLHFYISKASAKIESYGSMLRLIE